MSRRRGPSRANLRAAGRQTEKLDDEQPIYSARRPGRPTKLTPEVERRFLDCLRAGNYRTVCSAYSGLVPATVEKWIKRGRGTVGDRPATPEYIRFVRLVEEAEAASEVLVVGNLVARSKQDHNAGLAWLNRGPAERRARWRPDRDRDDDDDEMPDGSPRPPMLASGAPPALALPPGSVNYDQRQQVIVIARDQVPDVVSQLLVQQRADREAQRQAQAAATPTPEAPHDTRIARLDGLRADAADPEDDEAD